MADSSSATYRRSPRFQHPLQQQPQPQPQPLLEERHELQQLQPVCVPERERERDGFGLRFLEIVFLIIAFVCVALIVFVVGEIPREWWGRPLFLSVVGFGVAGAFIFDAVVVASRLRLR
jgi:hypothetical protein